VLSEPFLYEVEETRDSLTGKFSQHFLSAQGDDSLGIGPDNNEEWHKGCGNSLETSQSLESAKI